MNNKKIENIEPQSSASCSSYLEPVGKSYESKEPKVSDKPNKIEMPSRMAMAKNLSKSLINTAKTAVTGGKVIASTNLASQRMSICKACPWFVAKGQRCSKCGCVVPLKVYFEEEQCPIKKW
ncbi:hypothetical protein CMI37_19290 [Candidatus Pacearchaeota archaeon]|nr:hypothetical protein [Candidatus Pacearchaeota archaeon]|tara:strand:- start:1744 stop:2109 length:366 start_codon:yes stop_codon:yes gene_type:complete